MLIVFFLAAFIFWGIHEVLEQRRTFKFEKKEYEKRYEKQIQEMKSQAESDQAKIAALQTDLRYKDSLIETDKKNIGDLIKKQKDLKNRINELEKKKGDEEEDIIVEYYINRKNE